MKKKAGEDDISERLPRYIQKHLCPDLSLKVIKKGIEENQCFVNGRLERFHSYQIKKDDTVQFSPPIDKTFKILYEDKALAIIDKPPFIVCNEKKGLLGWRLVHRLDKETSGCLLLAKTPDIEPLLMALFKEREVKKTYIAAISGSPSGTKGVIKDPIQGQSALTEWKLLEKKKNASLLLCYPETGRTHQIRIHLANHGMPIIGDVKYGKKSLLNAGFKRILLHAKSLEFTHPLTHEKIMVEAPVPKEFYEAVDR